jgi:HTH-type transcriptional repressor of NAD biosynthesis genes
VTLVSATTHPPAAAPQTQHTLPVVCLIGGESTGKSMLAQALQHSLEQAHGLRAVHVPEYLRTWCEESGRAPRVNEQAAVAAEQSRRIHEAAKQPSVDLVIADTSALMVAVYSELYFADASLLPSARAEQSRYALNLLMGLDLPWTPDGLFRDSPTIRDATDTLLRRELDAARLPYQTIYGRQEARLQQALRAVGRWLGRDLLPADRALTEGRTPWRCDNCSDPDCERRLFTGLVGTPRR